MEGRDDGATVCSEKDGSGGPVLQLLRAEVQRWRDAWNAGDGEGGKRTFAASGMDGSDTQKNGQCNDLSISVLLPGGRYKAGSCSPDQSTHR